MKKKKALTPYLLTVLMLAVLGCSSSGTLVQEEETREINPKNNWTLKDHLRREAGVRVIGTGPNSRVIIRGESSTAHPTNQPLFVIDGQKAGHSFSSVNDMLYQGEIKSIEVLPPSRSAQYGMEGHYGVILIYTR